MESDHVWNFDDFIRNYGSRIIDVITRVTGTGISDADIGELLLATVRRIQDTSARHVKGDSLPEWSKMSSLVETIAENEASRFMSQRKAIQQIIPSEYASLVQSGDLPLDFFLKSGQSQKRWHQLSMAVGQLPRLQQCAVSEWLRLTINELKAPTSSVLSVAMSDKLGKTVSPEVARKSLVRGREKVRPLLAVQAALDRIGGAIASFETDESDFHRPLHLRYIRELPMMGRLLTRITELAIHFDDTVPDDTADSFLATLESELRRRDLGFSSTSISGR